MAKSLLGGSSTRSAVSRQPARSPAQASRSSARPARQLLLRGPGAGGSERGDEAAASEARGDGDKDDTSAPAVGAIKAVAQAWPDKPQLSQARFVEFKQAVQEKAKGSSSCRNFLVVGRCFRGTGCEFNHELPAWYEAVKRRFSSA